MEPRKIKVMTLNIRNYHNFEARKPKIIALIRKHNPDIVALQEARDDRSKNQEGMDQATQLNQELQYPHFTFLPATDMNKAKGLTDRPLCYEGIALLSKFPFSSEEFSLQKHKDDIYERKVLIGYVKLDNKQIPFFIVHFSPNDLFARLHAEQTLEYAEKIQPIIIGDLNIRSSEVEKLSKKHNFTSSTTYKYISFPEDKCSYDYILLPKYASFLSFTCLSDEVSDHRAIIAEITV